MPSRKERSTPPTTNTAARLGRRSKLNLALAMIILAGGFWTFPELKTRKPRTSLSTGELKTLVAGMTTNSRPDFDTVHKAQAAFGRQLFFDQRFSRHGTIACASCHDAAKSFTDQQQVAHGLKAGSKNTPTTINHFLNTWFMWDGRADSLAAQALKPVEDPDEHGFSRLGVTWVLLTDYATEYRSIFGEFPTALQSWRERQQQRGGLPPPAAAALLEKKFSLDLAAYGLATLGRFALLNDILAAAQKAERAPALELTERAFAGVRRELPNEWLQTFAQLSVAEAEAVNQVFANFGRALAAYQQGLVALESPFDLFAKRLVNANAAPDALNDTFDAAALRGLMLFATSQCTLCHAGPNFTDQQFHNIGLAQQNDTVDLGRAAGMLIVLADPFNCDGMFLKNKDSAKTLESCQELPFLNTNNPEMVGAFKTPSLRNVAVTAPYAHDGRWPTLMDALTHYNELAATPAVGHREELLKPLHLEPHELQDLSRFLESLTSSVYDTSLGQVVWDAPKD